MTPYSVRRPVIVRRSLSSGIAKDALRPSWLPSVHWLDNEFSKKAQLLTKIMAAGYRGKVLK